MNAFCLNIHSGLVFSIFTGRASNSIKKFLRTYFLFRTDELQVNNRNTRTRCSKLTIKTPERRHFTPCSGVSTVIFELVNAGWIESNLGLAQLLIIDQIWAYLTLKQVLKPFWETKFISISFLKNLFIDSYTYTISLFNKN